VENCITMVNEAAFDDNASQWEMWRKDKEAYKAWLGAKITDKVHVARSHGFRYRGQYDEQVPPMLEIAGGAGPEAAEPEAGSGEEG